VDATDPSDDGHGELFDAGGDELLRPQAEEELAGVGHRGPLAGRGQGSLLKHLVWTFGPVHRAFPFMLQLRVELEGERIVSVDPEVGWHHQGLEKRLEAHTWEDAVGLVEHLNPRAPHGHQLGFVLAVETLCGVQDQVPALAQKWRVILCELARILDHLLVFYQVLLSHPQRQAHSVVMRAALEVTDLLELAGESDDFRSQVRVGGLAALPREEMVASLSNRLHTAIDGARRVLAHHLSDRTFVDQVLGLGPITADHAAAFGLTGPALRATGVDDDLRLLAPAFAYGAFPPRAVTQTAGDALARLAVRAEEIESSVALIDRVHAAILADPDRRRLPVRLGPEELPMVEGRLVPPAGRVVSSMEVASGELATFVVADGGDKPVRVHFRPPSFFLAAGLPLFVTGATLDDLASILQGLGMIGTEIDR
jgi:NADH-quinone oxidoreductase subunit D